MDKFWRDTGNCVQGTGIGALISLLIDLRPGWITAVLLLVAGVVLEYWPGGRWKGD